MENSGIPKAALQLVDDLDLKKHPGTWSYQSSNEQFCMELLWNKSTTTELNQDRITRNKLNSNTTNARLHIPAIRPQTTYAGKQITIHGQHPDNLNLAPKKTVTNVDDVLSETSLPTNGNDPNIHVQDDTKYENNDQDCEYYNVDHDVKNAVDFIKSNSKEYLIFDADSLPDERETASQIESLQRFRKLLKRQYYPNYKLNPPPRWGPTDTELRQKLRQDMDNINSLFHTLKEMQTAQIEHHDKWCYDIPSDPYMTNDPGTEQTEEPPIKKARMSEAVTVNEGTQTSNEVDDHTYSQAKSCNESGVSENATDKQLSNAQNFLPHNTKCKKKEKIKNIIKTNTATETASLLYGYKLPNLHSIEYRTDGYLLNLDTFEKTSTEYLVKQAVDRHTHTNYILASSMTTDYVQIVDSVNDPLLYQRLTSRLRKDNCTKMKKHKGRIEHMKKSLDKFLTSAYRHEQSPKLTV